MVRRFAVVILSAFSVSIVWLWLWVVPSRSLPMNAMFHVCGSLSGFNPLINLQVGFSGKLQLQRYVFAICRCVCKICEKRLLASSCLSLRPSVRLHDRTHLPLEGFWWNFIFKLLSKICEENSIFLKIRQERLLLYMKPFSHLWQYFIEFLLKWEMF